MVYSYKNKKGGEFAEENDLKHIDGKKIRRQYFNIPLIIIYSMIILSIQL